MTQPEHLREECLTALDNYVRAARKTSELLGDLELTPSMEKLLAILVQAELERSLKEFYICARQRLCESFINQIVAFKPVQTALISQAAAGK